MKTLFTFEAIRDRMINRLKNKDSWKDVLYFGPNSRIIDVVSEEISYDMHYDEFMSRESNWDLARERSSLNTGSRFFNYFPHRMIGSSGYVRVGYSKNFDSSYPYNIEIKKFDVFSTIDGIQFVASNNISYISGQNYIDVSITQGTVKTVNFIASGIDFETFIIKNPNFENSVFDVKVNGVLYTNLKFIREANDTNRYLVYTLQNLKDFSGISIQFGNGLFGKKLSANDSIEVTYLETLGKYSNIGSVDMITSILSKLYDNNNPPNEVKLYCTNILPISGGLDYEDIESIRIKAPQSFGSGESITTASDYKSAIESFSFVKKSIVWGEVETNEDLGNIPGTYIPVEENVVNVSVVSSTSESINQQQVLIIRNTLNPRKSPTDIVRFVDPIFNYLRFVSQVFIRDRKYSLNEINSNIENKLSSDYSIDNMGFKQNIYQSDYISKINSISGVEFHNTVLELYTVGVLNTLTKTYDINFYMGNVKKNSVSVWVLDVNTQFPIYSKIAEDNGAGTLNAIAPYTIGAGIINYLSGIGSVSLSYNLEPNHNYMIKVVYQIDDTLNKNIIPTKRYQLISYGESIITSQYIG